MLAPNLHRPCRPSQVIPRGSGLPTYPVSVVTLCCSRAKERGAAAGPGLLQAPAPPLLPRRAAARFFASPSPSRSARTPSTSPSRSAAGVGVTVWPTVYPTGSGCPDATSGGYAAGAQLGSRLSQEDRSGQNSGWVSGKIVSLQCSAGGAGVYYAAAGYQDPYATSRGRSLRRTRCCWAPARRDGEGSSSNHSNQYCQ